MSYCGNEERRADRRLLIRLSVIFTAEDRVELGNTGDISLGGMFIETAVPVESGARITVKFRAAGLEQPQTVPAVVRWMEPGRGMGVQFGSMRPSVVWALQQELKQR